MISRHCPRAYNGGGHAWLQHYAFGKVDLRICTRCGAYEEPQKNGIFLSDIPPIGDQRRKVRSILLEQE